MSFREQIPKIGLSEQKISADIEASSPQKIHTGLSEIASIQQYYLPHMKNLYQQSYKNLPDPEQIISILSMAERKFGQLQKQNHFLKSLLSSKQAKIKQLLAKGTLNSAKSMINFQSNKVLQQSESLMEVKMNEFLFRMKIKMSSCLQELQIGRAQIFKFQQLHSQGEIIENFIQKIKKRVQSMKVEYGQSLSIFKKDKQQLEINQNEHKLLLMQLKQLKQSEKRLKQKISKLNTQNSQLNDLCQNKENQISAIHSEIYKLKTKNTHNEKVIDNLHEALKSKETETKILKTVVDDQSLRWKDLFQKQVEEKNKIRTLYDQKVIQLEDLQRINQRKNFEVDQLHRECLKWKNRAQWVEIQKKSLEDQLHPSNEVSIISKQNEQQLKRQLRQSKQALLKTKLQLQQLTSKKNNLQYDSQTKLNSLREDISVVQKKLYQAQNLREKLLTESNSKITKLQTDMAEMAKQWKQKLIQILQSQDKQIEAKNAEFESILQEKQKYYQAQLQKKQSNLRYSLSEKQHEKQQLQTQMQRYQQILASMRNQKQDLQQKIKTFSMKRSIVRLADNREIRSSQVLLQQKPANNNYLNNDYRN